MELIKYTKAVDLKRLEFIKSSLKDFIGDSGSILDVGCGNGIISTHLGAEGYEVTGIDVSDKAIEKARENNPYPNVSFRNISAEEVSLEGSAFDAVICSEVLEHLDRPELLLRDIYGALKDDGILIVTVPNGKGPRESLVTKPMLSLREKDGWGWKTINKLKKNMGYSGSTIQSDADNLDHVQFFTKKDLQALSENNNFKIIKMGPSNFMDDVFPVSFLSNRIFWLQKLDCSIADVLPTTWSGGFNTIWKKK